MMLLPSNLLIFLNHFVPRHLVEYDEKTYFILSSRSLDMTMCLSVAKICWPLKSTEHIYEVILTNTELSHVKSGADMQGKENVILVDFFF